MSTYSEPPDSFDALIAPFPESIQGVATTLRRTIQNLLPDADENVSGGMKYANALYSLGNPNNVVCGVSPTRDHCKLYVHHVRPGDLPGVKLEGSGKYVRHVKVRTAAEAEAESINRLLARARAGARRS